MGEQYDDCMLWTGSLSSNGYARVVVKRNGKWTSSQLHRELYYVEKGDIPDGYVLDHLCRNRNCINTDHLEPVTNKENLRRGDRPKPYTDYCNHGHLLSEVGIYVFKRNSRVCKGCVKERLKRKKIQG